MTDIKQRPVKEMWWEGTNFHIIYKDNNEHVMYENANITNHSAPITIIDGTIKTEAIILKL